MTRLTMSQHKKLGQKLFETRQLLTSLKAQFPRGHLRVNVQRLVKEIDELRSDLDDVLDEDNCPGLTADEINRIYYPGEKS